MTAAERIADALTRVTGMSPRSSGGEWVARCPVPAHEDRSPSLGLRQIEGQALVCCRAGCHTEDVLAALGLTMRDLYDEPRGRELARYHYTDAAGQTIRTVHRLDPARLADGEGRFKQSGGKTLPQLYRLPAVAAGATVYLAEGEKDVHALEALGLVATTAPMGAANFGKVDVSPLKGASVVAVVDRDAAGTKWASMVRERLDGYAAGLRLVEAAHGKDAADHIAAGHGVADFTPFEHAPDEPPMDAAARMALLVEREAERVRIAREAKRIVDAEQRPRTMLPELLTLRERLARPLPPVAWRIQDWQPADARVILAAQFKAGKTTVTGNLARCLVDGDPFLGQHKVTRIAGRLALLDFEMSARQLDAWLGDQHMVNDDQVLVFPMRGSAAAFDILDPAVRARWAKLFRERDVGYVLWDCLRPVMDALGLDEHSDAGRLLVAYDALLREAEISESLIVHHMGHNGERSRGDSRIRDWPDAEWRLIRQDDDPASARFITAFGRDVDVPESQLTYDPNTRHLTLLGGSRKDAAASSALQDVLDLLAATPKLSGRQIEDGLTDSTEHHRGAVREAVKIGIRTGRIVTERGPRRAVLHSQCASAPECAASAPAHSSECASALIESALHSDTRETFSAPDAQCCKGGSIGNACQLCSTSPTYSRTS